MISETRKLGDIDLIYYQGELTDESVDLLEAVSVLIENGTTKILVNLDGISYMSSSGVGMLVRLLVELKEAGATMKLLSPSETARKVLDTVNFSNIMETYETEREAIAGFASIPS